MPPQTPEMTRLVLLRSRRVDCTWTLPSLRVLVCDGDRESRECRHRDGRVLCEVERPAGPDRGAGKCTEAEAPEIGRERRRDGREGDDAGGDEHRAGAP